MQVHTSMSGAKWYSVTGEHWYASELAAWSAYLARTADALEGK